MAERRFALLLFPGEGRGPGAQRTYAAGAPSWAPAFAGEQLFGECDR